MGFGRLPQIAAIGAAAALLLLIALYVVRPHQTEVSPPSVRAPAAARSVYPSIVVDTPAPSTPSPDTTPRVLDVESGDVQAVTAPSDLTFAHVLSNGALPFANGIVGPATVIAHDGSVVANLDVSGNREYRISVEGRYVAWLTAVGDLHVYDAANGITTSAVSADARFEKSLGDGAVLLPDDPGSAIVNARGTVEKTLAAGDGQVAVSPDGERLAWLESSGLHVYDRRTRIERTNQDVQLATSRLTWSTDGTELALERLVGDNSAHVAVLDVASGAQREVYAGAPGFHIQPLKFVSPHRLEFGVLNLLLARYSDIPGPRYQINDDGTGGAFIDPPDRAWSTCGPSCGMPPDGYESADGIARWCELMADKSCVLHTAYVDRTRGSVREFVSGNDFVPIAVSPDRTRIAMAVTDATRNQTIRVIRLDDFTTRDFPLGFTLANNLTWLPDGHSLLLCIAGGN